MNTNQPPEPETQNPLIAARSYKPTDSMQGPTLLQLISGAASAGLLHRPNEVGTPLGVAPPGCQGPLRAATRCKLSAAVRDWGL